MQAAPQQPDPSRQPESNGNWKGPARPDVTNPGREAITDTKAFHPPVHSFELWEGSSTRSSGRTISIYYNTQSEQVRAHVTKADGTSFDVPLGKNSARDKGKARSVRKELPEEALKLVEERYARLESLNEKHLETTEHAPSDRRIQQLQQRHSAEVDSGSPPEKRKFRKSHTPNRKGGQGFNGIHRRRRRKHN